MERNVPKKLDSQDNMDSPKRAEERIRQTMEQIRTQCELALLDLDHDHPERVESRLRSVENLVERARHSLESH